MALWTAGGEGVRCDLGWGAKALYDRLRHRCSVAVRGVSLQAFAREVRSLGFSAAHRRRATTIGWWKCSGVSAIFFSKKTAQKGRAERENCCTSLRFYFLRA